MSRPSAANGAAPRASATTIGMRVAEPDPEVVDDRAGRSRRARSTGTVSSDRRDRLGGT